MSGVTHRNPTATSVAALSFPNWLQRRDGAMTRQLLLNPGQHGLGLTHESIHPDLTTTSVCGYCSTGCGLRVHLRDGQAVGLTAETKYPVNLGMACPKGWEALQVLQSSDRATDPLLRDSSGSLVPVSWDRALTTFTQRFKRIIEQHGNESVAFISTGQIPCEEMVLLGSLAKFGMGLIHGDGNTRQCMATSVSAYKESFGFDAPPFTYEDFEESDCLVFVGANPCIAHPIMWERVLKNKRSPEIIVIDPRRTETAMAATSHLQIAPKSDLLLLYSVAQQLIENNWIDHEFVDAHTNGFEQLSQFVSQFTPQSVASRVGIAESAIRQLAQTIGTRERVSLWWTMGVNQSHEGTRTAQAIINLALLTGNIGKPGTGANSITGQCNAMGSRLWSNTTNLLGHHRFESPEDRQRVADVLGIDVARIPQRGSWSYDQIIDGVRSGKVKGLWVIATNPAHSWIDQNECREVLSKLDFLCVQDMYASTETAQMADLLLPAAGWGEKEGTFINSERRYGLLKKVTRAPGQALSDFSIFKAISHYWGVGDMFSQWNEPEDVFRTMQELSRGRPCDITGIQGYQQIDACGGIQWPWAVQSNAIDSTPPAHRRLFADGQFYHADQRAKLIYGEPTSMPELPDAAYPFLLLSGRGTVSQWHTQTRTAKSPILRRLYPNEAYVDVNTNDAIRLGITHGQQVDLTSRRGSIRLTANVVTTVQPGQLFAPMHYDIVNQLTLAHFDPYSRQPSYKACAVSIKP
jgi:anaerobic selenocysteine-containing dehydrogenase